MADQTQQPGPGDVADERGRFGADGLPGDPPMIPDTDIDATARPPDAGESPTGRRSGAHGAAIEDLADPEADANFPEPSRPIAMDAGAGPGRGSHVPGGGYGDSRDAGVDRPANVEGPRRT